MLCPTGLVILFLASAALAAHEGNIMSNKMANVQYVTTDKVPYAVQLRNPHGEIYCVGTLISTQHVLTAAHCFDFYKIEEFTVVIAANTKTDLGIPCEIEKVIKHESYNAGTLYNDVAVLKLKTPVEQAKPFVVPICSEEFDASSEWHQQVGWTRDEYRLKSSRTPLIAPEECKQYASEQGFSIEMADNMFCDHYKSRVPCLIVSGGPAIYKGEVCAIVLGGALDCENPKYPGLLISVYAFRDFIENCLKA